MGDVIVLHGTNSKIEVCSTKVGLTISYVTLCKAKIKYVLNLSDENGGGANNSSLVTSCATLVITTLLLTEVYIVITSVLNNIVTRDLSKGVPMAREIPHSVLSMKYSRISSITASKLVCVFDVVLKHWNPSFIKRDGGHLISCWPYPLPKPNTNPRMKQMRTRNNPYQVTTSIFRRFSIVL